MAARNDALSMRIALISVHGDPLVPIGAEEAGGQNVYVGEVGRALARRGHQVDIFTRGRDCSDIEIHPLNDRLQVVRLPCGPRGFLSRNSLFAHLPAFVAQMDRYARMTAATYDVIHSNYWLSGWAGMRQAREWNVAHVHTNHSLGAVKFAAEGGRHATGSMRLMVEEQVLASAHVIATSPQEVEVIRKAYVARPGVEVIPCGVDDQKFQPLDQAACRSSLGIAEDALVLGYVGRFDPLKGIETFVRAAALVAADLPVQLVITGGYEPGAHDGREYERITALIDERGLTACTRMLGKVPQDALARVYAALDVCVVPSHYESFGLVTIEAMACGRPVVASRVGGLQYTVDEGHTGLLAPVKDAAAFATACRAILTQPELRERMGRAAFRRVQSLFTWDAVSRALEANYARLAQGTLRRAHGA